jgi:hypothetical protein
VRALAALLALGLLLAPAGGQAAAAEGEMTLSGPLTILVKMRSDKVGDRYRFASETTLEESGDNAGRQFNRQVFDIEVLAVRKTSMMLRYTLREVTIEDARQPGIERAMSALIGVPLEFTAKEGITPEKVLNEAAVRKAYFENLQRIAPDDADLARNMNGFFDNIEGRMATELAGDVFVLAAVQLPMLQLGKVELKPEVLPFNGGTMRRLGTMEISDMDSGNCQLTYLRKTTGKGEGIDPMVTFDLSTTTTLSTFDGWTMALREQRTMTSGQAVQTRTVKIDRLSAKTDCAG